tara:strand:+ start:735 stop:4187 length:3453 start_codon:yes stop_codon:yes gene_type:complete
MSKDSHAFLLSLQEYALTDRDLAVTATTTIEQEISTAAAAVFDANTREGGAIDEESDPQYDPETHTSFELWTGDKHGTDVAKEAWKTTNTELSKYLTPEIVYGGCSSKAMIEILGPHTPEIADDEYAWQNLQSKYDEEGSMYALIDTLSQKDSSDAGEDTYGKSSVATFEEYGFDPCDPSKYDYASFQNWLADVTGKVYGSSLGRSINKSIRDKQSKWYNNTLLAKATYAKDIVAETEAAAAQTGKKIAAYSRVDNIKFKEQCFLLSNVQALSMIKKNLEAQVPKAKPNNTPEGNACVLLQGDPFGLINKLTQNAHKEEFFEMPSAALSSLQPMIRLYKVVADETGKNERQVEIKFDSHYSVEDAKDLLTNKANRGHGVGISSFNFSYEANNPYAIKKSIKAKLVIHANNFSELLRDRNGTVDPSKNAPYAPPGKPVPYRYIDLAMKTWDPDGATRDMNKINPQQREVVQKNMDKLTFRLKAVIGWANPSAKSTKTARNTWATATDGRITPNILDAIYDSCITLNLTPTVHTFDIDEMGRVKFTLNYLAYVEDFFDAPSFNIFTDPVIAVKQVIRKSRYKQLSEDCNSKEVNEIKNSESETKQIEREKVRNFRYLMNSMLKKKKMRFMEVPLEELTKYRQGGPLKQLDGKLLQKFAEDMRKADASQIVGTASKTDAVGNSINAAVDAAAKEATQNKKTTDPADPGDDSKAKSGSTGKTPTATEVENALNPLQTVAFFYVSDLMDVMLENIGTTLKGLPDGIRNHKKYKLYTELMEQEAVDYTRYAENFARFRLALGPVELINSNKEGKVMESFFVNFGDIPISAKYFMEFLTTKVLKTDRQAYPLPKFLNDFFNELIRDFLNNDTCYGNRAKQKTRVSQSSITSYKKKAPLDNITAAMGNASRLDITNYSGEQLPILDVYGERGSPVSSKDIKDETNFLIFFAARTQPTDIMRGCKGGMKHKCYDDNGVEILGDHDRGLWHYQIGKDRGIVKTIQLEKTDSPGLAEVRFEQEGYDGLAQLRVLYDAKIKTYLDVNAFPGSYIYIEPRGFDPGAVSTDLTRMGVGGYYMIIRSSHTLGAGMAETEITAKWVAEVDKHIEEKGKADEKPTKKKSKCYSDGDRKSKSQEQPFSDWFGSFFSDSKGKDDGTTKK